MKIALVHDQLKEFGGAERVFVALKRIFPEADVYTSFYKPEALGIHNKHFKNWNIRTSWAQKIPFFDKLYSPLRFLAPMIWESFDFSEYDVVLSSSGWYMSKGIVTKPPTLHICYLHHQPRYLYNYETAVEWQKYWPVRVYAAIVNHELRQWDYISSQRPNFFIANSEETKKRIKKFYRREDVTVIYPPVDIPTEPTHYQQPSTNYYVTTSRLARAKHIEVLIEAANKMKFRLKIIGEGRDKDYLQSLSGGTVEFLGHISDEKFEEIYLNAKAFLFASVDEEFGIAPIEAMGYGLPVIAYASGGLKETVIEGKNGYLYEDLSAASLIEKIKKLESLNESEYVKMKQYARKEAEKYSFERFEREIMEFVKNIT